VKLELFGPMNLFPGLTLNWNENAISENSEAVLVQAFPTGIDPTTKSSIRAVDGVVDGVLVGVGELVEVREGVCEGVEVDVGDEVGVGVEVGDGVRVEVGVPLTPQLHSF
jgi:hypothetical protein